METETKKWKIDLYGNVTDLRGKIVHTPKWYKSDLSHRKQVIANAKLIAAAPELLEALFEAKRIISTLELLTYAEGNEEMKDRIANAIKKATE